MLEKAKENAGELCKNIHFQRMDAQKLEFADNTFDIVISRNLTWNLEHPDVAYREWVRVLKAGGRLLNFDANWYGYLYEEEQRKAYENDRKNVENNSLDDHYLCTDIERMERIALQVPLSKINRPQWDVKTLRARRWRICPSCNHHPWKRSWKNRSRHSRSSCRRVCGDPDSDRAVEAAEAGKGKGPAGSGKGAEPGRY